MPSTSTILFLAASPEDEQKTEPSLLRRLRLRLAGRGTDIGCEHEVWNHPWVCADELACVPRPGQRPEAERTFARLPAKMQATMVRARREGNRHLWHWMPADAMTLPLGGSAWSWRRLRAAPRLLVDGDEYRAWLAVVDPEGPAEGRKRVLRGGSWLDFGGLCRPASRDGGVPGFRYVYFGFRLARGSSP